MKTYKLNTSKRLLNKNADSKQMILDFGQKYYGPILCKKCGFLYTANSKDDERLHKINHENLFDPIKFNGWKNERVVGEYIDGQIILLNTDKLKNSEKLKKIKYLVSIDLGTHDIKFNSENKSLISPNEKIFLYISKNRVIGFCSSEEIKEAYEMNITNNIISKNPSEQMCKSLPSDENYDKYINKKFMLECNSKIVDTNCGINQLWVHQKFQRKKLASRLIDCVLLNFYYGSTLTKKDIAFSTPTIDGLRFIKSYLQTDNILIYFNEH
ncbi:unnamed protein product [Gordionus sp. m RMFG-2023]